MLLAVLAVLEKRTDGRLRWAVLAGIACGLAALTRSNGVLLVVAAGLGAWTVRPRFSRAALVSPLAIVLTALVTVLPWVARNSIVFDRFVGISTQAGVGLAGTYNAESRREGRYPGHPRPPWQLATFRALYERPDLDEAERSAHLNKRALDYLREHPGYVFESVAWNTLRVFEVVRDQPFERVFPGLVLHALGVQRLVSPLVPVSLYVVVALALIGVAAQAGALRSPRAPPFVWAFPLLMVLPAVAVWGLSRYRVPVDPFLVMLAAVGVVAAAEAVSRRRSRRVDVRLHARA
jgi:4-amino-4-deoxy-L-arabinose transferase-like glycosyltransferase